MRPILLKIKGINSFEEEQIIDFDKLTSNGLFGIFGPTGSGKTSILDAITLALYGEISRYDGDSKNKKFINTNVENAMVSFEFAISTVVGEENYVVERGYKKNDKTQKVVLARLYTKTNEGNKVLADKSSQVTLIIEEIIGLSYKDFSKTVILPQGKFSEFLLLANTERRNMLERIFRLEKYGEKLLGVIRKEYIAKNQELKIINTKLEMYGDISLELIKENEKKLNKLNIELKELKFEQEEIIKESNMLKNTQTLCKQLKYYEEQLNNLNTKKETIKNEKMFLIKAKQTKLIMPIYTECKQTMVIKEENESKLRVHKELYKELIHNERLIYSNLNDISNIKKIELPVLTQKKYNLNQAMEIVKDKHNIETERKKLLKDYDTLKKDLSDAENNIESLEKKRASLKESIKHMIERRKVIQLDSSVKSLAEKALNIYNKLTENKEKLQIYISKYDKYNNQILEYEKKLKETNIRKYDYESKIINISINVKNQYDITKTNMENENSEIHILENELEYLQKTIKDAETNNLVFKVAEMLKEDKPCPVCGSLSHPSPILNTSSFNFNEELKKEETLKKRLDNKINTLNKYKLELSRLDNLSKDIKSQLKDFSNNVNNIEEKKIILEQTQLEHTFRNILQTINELNTNREVLIVSIKKDKDAMKDVEETIKTLENEVEEYTGFLKDVQNELKTESIIELNKKIKQYDSELTSIIRKQELDNNSLDDINMQLEKLNLQYQNTKSKIDKIIILGKEKADVIKKYDTSILNLSEGKDLKTYLQEIIDRINEIETNEEKAKNEYEKVKKELNKEAEIKAGLEKEKETINNILAKQEEKLQNLIYNYNFKDINDALEYNISEEDIILKEKEIKDYDNFFNDTINNINRIEKEIDNTNTVNIDERVKFVIDKESLINKNILEYTQKLGVIKENINKMKLDYIEIKELEKGKKKLIGYIDILEDLSKLFEGKKFVEFIAKKQLRYIAVDASTRLKNMSFGRYSLELDDTDFIIRDDHYGGIRRSPKTLSGGETFMASLCLALALSSKIQLKNKSTLKFFFLDEGFGTLDVETLDIVMESLIKLESQQLKVGVISHVEEMKSRIPSKLIVTQAIQGIHGTLVNLE